MRRSIAKGDVDGITTICFVRSWDARLIELGDGRGEEEAEGKEEAEKSWIHASLTTKHWKKGRRDRLD